MEASVLADKSLRGEALSREESLAVLDWPEDDVLSLLAAAYRVRRAKFGKRVKLNYLVNLRSGNCGEDCSYCSQSGISRAPIDRHEMLSAEQVLAAARSARERKAARLCLVVSGRGPNGKDIASIGEAVRRVKKDFPELEVCVSLGFLSEGQAAALKAAGVIAYNHNLNTSQRYYGAICTTHGFEDRLATIEEARGAGLSCCSGAVFGMGETREDVLDVAYRLREMKVESVPINFLIPIQGTPMEGREELTPAGCLKILCLFRLLCPEAELRVAGGRELHLRGLQPLSLLAANSIFIGDYLTTEGQAAERDLEMIGDMGLEILGAAPVKQASVAEKVVLLPPQSPHGDAKE